MISTSQGLAYATFLADRLQALDSTARVEQSSEQIKVTGNEGLLSPLVNSHATISVTSDKSTIAANGIEKATLTCGLISFNYTIYRTLMSDTSAGQTHTRQETMLGGLVNDGVLNFSSDTAGLYVIEIISDNASGYVEVTVS